MKEVIAISLLMGAVSLGFSFPLHKLPRTKIFWFVIACIVITYSVLITNVRPVYPVFVFIVQSCIGYFFNALVGAAYVYWALVVSSGFDKQRKTLKQSPYKWLVSRWLGLPMFLSLLSLASMFRETMGNELPFMGMFVSLFFGILMIAMGFHWVLLLFIPENE